MNDLISRQGAIETLAFAKEMLNRMLDNAHVVGIDRKMFSWGLGLIESSINDIEELPSAQQWIPVTEHLPRESQTVIASVDAGIYPEARFEDGRWWWELEAGADYWEEIEKDVTAWMPLPEPYKEV